MRPINKVELQGIVGNILTRPVTDHDACASFSLATEEYYKTPEGTQCVVEVTWHNVLAWQSKMKNIQLTDIQKGDRLHILGRIRNKRYIDATGADRYATEIIATTIRKIQEQ